MNAATLTPETFASRISLEGQGDSKEYHFVGIGSPHVSSMLMMLRGIRIE